MTRPSLTGVRPPEEPADHPDYRFTLANERTLLAWLRTGLALVAGGVAVATYAPDLGVRWGSAAVALALVLVGLGTVAAGYRRWRSNEAAIVAGRPLPASWLLPTVASAVAAVVVVVGVLVGIQVLGR
jgi:putative membrane protein